MNKNLLKLRNIQEANKALEKRLLSEQTAGPVRNMTKDLEPNDILEVTDKENQQRQIIVLNILPPMYGGFNGEYKKTKNQFKFGPADNQLQLFGSEPGNADFTVNSVIIDGKKFPVKQDGTF